jgi:hypothetical protein
MAISAATKTAIGNAVAAGVTEGLTTTPFPTNTPLYFGTSSERKIVYDGTNLLIGAGLSSIQDYGMASLGIAGAYANVVERLDQFFELPTGRYTSACDSGGSVAIRNEQGGWIRCATPATSAKHACFYEPAECWKLTATEWLLLATRIRVSDATNCKLFVGLTTLNTGTPVADYEATTLADGVFFYKATGGTDVLFKTRKNGSEQSTSVHTLNTNAVWLGIVWNGSGCVPWVNGVAGSSQSGAVDDEELSFHADIVAGAAAAKYLDLDTLLIRQKVV